MKKILFLDDHSFWSQEIVEYLKEEKGLDVHYAQSYNEAQAIMKKDKSFDMAILDVILQNGKTGIHFAEEHKEKLGDIIFITGCNDEFTLNALKSYKHASKLDNVWPTLDKFIEDNKNNAWD